MMQGGAVAGWRTSLVVSTDEAPLSDVGVRRAGYAILFLVFGVFGTWAALAPLQSAALAPGLVTVKSYRKTVEHLEGGIVRDLLVRDGDRVSEGDPLIILDDTQINAEREAVAGQLLAFEAMEARLQAERDGREAIAFAASGNDPRAQSVRASEQAIFEARRAARLGESAVLAQRLTQIDEEIGGLEAIIVSKQALLDSLDEEIGDLSALLEEGFVDKQRLREQQRAAHRLQAEIADHRAGIARARAERGATELEILQLNKNATEEVVNQLGEVQTRLFELRERLAALEDRRRRTVIRAPATGLVLGMQVHTVGGVIRPATPILDVVPGSGELVVDVQISPLDIDRVEQGMLADVRFSAFKHATTPNIEGRLTRVSADRLVDKESGQPYYLGRVELTDQGQRQLQGLALVPGMPAEVLINTGERTLLEYLVQPATDAFARSLIED